MSAHLFGGSSGVFFGTLGDDLGDVAGALADPCGPAPSTGAPATEGGPLVGVGLRHDQLVGVESVVVFGIGDCRAQHLAHRLCGRPSGETQDLVRLLHRKAADQVEDLTHLVGRLADEAGVGSNSHPRLAACSLRPAWPRNVRVGANSPSLWPTIDSVM